MVMDVPDVTVLLLIFFVESLQVSLILLRSHFPEAPKGRLLLSLRHDGLTTPDLNVCRFAPAVARLLGYIGRSSGVTLAPNTGLYL
jgi:hypothetical protein